MLQKNHLERGGGEDRRDRVKLNQTKKKEKTERELGHYTSDRNTPARPGGTVYSLVDAVRNS